ncbi:MAG: hypothetical protein ABII10_03415 [Candidatus Paceibacterota bacterium]
MKWIGISGSWRITNSKIKSDVRRIVIEIINRGDGLVTGGALNVDSFALDEALTLDPTARKIRVFLPVTLEKYAAHYRQRAQEGVITINQAEDLIELLSNLKKTNPEALIENQLNTKVNQETYYQRNAQIINFSDELMAFQVNESAGTQDIIERAEKRGIPVRLYSYRLPT